MCKSTLFYLFRINMNMKKEKQKLDISGEELVSLAGSLAICLAKKYSKEDLKTLRLFFQSVASNITIIEIQSIDFK